MRLAEFKMRLFVFFADRLLRWAGPAEGADAKTSLREQPAPAFNDKRETSGPPEHWTRLMRSTPPQHWLDLFPGKALEIAAEGEIAGDEIVAGEVSAELFSTEIPDDETDRGLENLAGFVNDEPPQTLSDEVPKHRRNDPRYPAVPPRERSWLDRLHFPAPPPRPIAEARPSGRAIPAPRSQSDSTFNYPSTAKERLHASEGTFVESSSASGRQPWTNPPLKTRNGSDPSLTVGLLPPSMNGANKTSYADEVRDEVDESSAREPLNYLQPTSGPRSEALRFINRPGPSSSREDAKPESTINSSSTTQNREATTFVEDTPRSSNRPSFQSRARSRRSILNIDDLSDNKRAQAKLRPKPPAVMAQNVAKAAEPMYVERSAARTLPVRPTPAAVSRSLNQPMFIDSARPDRTFAVSNSETPIDSNDDRWPALPPPPLFEMTDELSLREEELRSLRRIDREQRGVLWNE